MRVHHRLLLAGLSLLVALLATAVVASGHPLDATDTDHDGFKNVADNCPNNYNPKQTDTDGDTPPPIVDTDIDTPQTGPVDVYPFTDGQGLPTDRPADAGGDACDIDDDGDGITDNPKRDNCKLVPNPDQADTDFDGLGDACDSDDDNDDITDDRDNCPAVSNSRQTDADKDGTGDACDPDGPKGGASGLGGADPNDKTAPKIALRAPRTMLLEQLGRGLPVGVRCSEGCTLEGELMLARKRIGRGAAQVEAKGFTWVFVNLTKKTRKQLQRRPTSRPTLRVIARDANGNRTVATRRLTVRR